MSLPFTVVEVVASVALFAGAVIVENADGTLQHFNWLGYLVIAVLAVTVTLMYFLHKAVPERGAASAAPSPGTEAA